MSDNILKLGIPAGSLQEAGVFFVDDPSIGRGGVKVISENSQIDATIEGRLDEIVSRVMDGNAEPDSEQ